MKKFSFSLQRLMNYKEQLFDSELMVLSDMRGALQKMQDEHQNLKEEHFSRCIKFNELAAIGTTAQEMEMQKMYLRILDSNIEKKAKQISLQLIAIDKQTDKVREAKLEISTIEKLKERKLEEYQHMEAKATELFIDEFVTNTRSTLGNN